jgi:hypothetical protein
MPTLSASDYTAFVKAQAASLAYQNGAIPRTIQTSAQPYAIQSVLNASLLASQAAYVAASPATVKTQLPVVTAATITPINLARGDILTAAVGDGVKITYTSAVPHGLVAGTVITITGFAVLTAANVTATAVTAVLSTTSFTITNATSGTATGTGYITIGSNKLAYYTTSVPHGLVAGGSVAVSGLTATAYNTVSTTITNVGDPNTFALSTNTTAASSGADLGTITVASTNYVYYTTASNHGLTANRPTTTYIISGLTGNTTFNLSAFTIPIVTNAINFIVASNTPAGSAITGKSGSFMETATLVSRTVINGNARIRPFVGTGNVNNPKNLSTTHASTSTTMSSGKYPQLGGLPLTSAKSDGVYSPVPHLARVDTRATGAYKSVRPSPFS